MDKVKSDNESLAKQSGVTKASSSASFSANANPNLILSKNVKLAFMKMRKKILELLYENKYVDLKNLLLTHKDELETFFSIEGPIILDWAVIKSKNIMSFMFLYENIPQFLLQKALRNNEYYIIKAFLRVESVFENSEFDVPERQELQREKFKLLLSIDSKNVPEFMEQNASQDFSTAKIKSNFAYAVNEYKKQHKNFSL
jgi:hypothetical protein